MLLFTSQLPKESMKDALFLGGYYLIEGSTPVGWQHNSLLPAKFYTPSACLCQHHPDSCSFRWVDCPEDSKSRYRSKLNLSLQEFEILQQKLDLWFEQKRLGWGEIFIDLSLAKEFASTYFKPFRTP